MIRKKKKIGLALGGGAARGWAHLGVLRALEESGLEVSCVAGTSAGALVGAAYASGRVNELQTMALNTDWREVLYYFSDLTFSRSGLIDGKKVCNLIRKYVSASLIEDLPIPFNAIATDILTGEEVVFDRGEVIDAVRASISFPGIFTPVNCGDHVLVDGGLVNPVPVNTVRNMGADFVIAVDLNHDRIGSTARAREKSNDKNKMPGKWEIELPEPLSRMSEKLIEKVHGWDVDMAASRWPWMKKRGRLPHIFDIIGNSTRIMEGRISDAMLDLDPPDVLIRPDVGYISFMEFNRASQAIAAGFEAAIDPLLAAATGIKSAPLHS